MKENHAVKVPPREISKNRIIEELKEIGVAEGDHLAVVLSLRSVGYVVGGPKTFVEALLEVVGPSGTIMMNTHTRGFPLSEVAKDYVYNYKVTPCWTGVVPETLRKWQNAMRSKNPITSVTAVGRLAEYLTKGHDEKADLYAPYSRLAAVGGKYLCIGLMDNLVAIRHEAQHLAGLDDVVKMFYGVKYVDDCGTVRLYVFNHPPCAGNLPRLVPKLKASGILRTGKIGSAKAYLASTQQLLDSIKELLVLNQSLTLCDRIYCLWCREAERKLNLYTSANKSKSFKKNFIFIVLRLINPFRLRRYLFLSFQNKGGTRLSEYPKSIFADMFSHFPTLCFLKVVDLLK